MQTLDAYAAILVCIVTLVEWRDVHDSKNHLYSGERHLPKLLLLFPQAEKDRLVNSKVFGIEIHSTQPGF